MNIHLPQLSTDYNTNMLHLLPTIFVMRGEHEESGEPAGLMLGLTWLGATLSLVWA
jgi:hypothetical protein